jgi:hypothetical protein
VIPPLRCRHPHKPLKNKDLRRELRPNLRLTSALLFPNARFANFGRQQRRSIQSALADPAQDRLILLPRIAREKEMRTSAHLYPSSSLVLFLLELLGPRFVAARVRYHTDDIIEVKYCGNPEECLWTRWHSRLPAIRDVSAAAAPAATQIPRRDRSRISGFHPARHTSPKSRRSLLARPIHNSPLGIQLSRGQRAVLQRAWRSYASGRRPGRARITASRLGSRLAQKRKSPQHGEPREVLATKFCRAITSRPTLGRVS